MKLQFKKGTVLCVVLLFHSQLYSQQITNHQFTNQKKGAQMEIVSIEIENKEAIRNLYENIMNNRKFELLKGLIAEEYISISGTKGPLGFQEQIEALVKAFPDAKWHADDIICEGNKVIIRQKFQGTHLGEFQHFSATGKSVSNTGTGFYTFKNGKIISSEIQTDRLSFLQQLGIIPTDLKSL